MRTILILFLSTVTLAVNGHRGELLCSIDNRKVSIFINSIYEDAEKVCKKYDLPLGLLIAQACLESGFGSSYYARERCNFLGIKYEGVYAEFESAEKCFEAWARVLSKDCYKEIPTTSLNLWLYQLDACCYHMAGGRYSRKIRSIYYKYGLDILNNWKTY